MLTKPLADQQSAIDQPAAVAGTNTIERDFYSAYDWALNPFLTVAEALSHLSDEIAKFGTLPSDWRRAEVATNIYLLASTALHSAEEYLRGRTFRLPGKLASTRLFRAVSWLNDLVSNNPLARQRIGVAGWRDSWLTALHPFLQALAAEAGDVTACAVALARLAQLASVSLPVKLAASRIGVPSPFRRLDLSHHDVISLGHLLAATYADKSEKLLLVGLRTSGSYFAPLIRAVLANEGFGDIALATMEPGKGPGRWERQVLRQHARAGYTAIIVDDPPHSGSTVFTTFEILRKLGFPHSRCKALVPSHPAKPNWHKPLPASYFVVLPPDRWRKRALLETGPDQALLARYFGAAPGDRISVSGCDGNAVFEARMKRNSADPRMERLKRVFMVGIESGDGGTQTRYVIGKSVGWGWLGYHAFLAGDRLAGMVPPVVALRDGILYTEYFPQGLADVGQLPERGMVLETAADYVAARVRHLRLKSAASSAMDMQRHNNGLRLLEKAMSRNYGRFPTDTLMRSRIGGRLRPLFGTLPVLIDGAMQPGEWIFRDGRALKTDFEHHGLGKGPVNVIDPAFDLAEIMLSFGLSPEEQDRLVARYASSCGDADAGQRLVLNKLAAGLWSMNQAQEQILAKTADAATAERQHQRFMAAWNFLTVEMARFCGRLYGLPQAPTWRAPLVALDIDGVIDLRLMGFPATTMAGARALAILTANRISAIVNTARSVPEVRDYCRAYGLAGAVAEHGGYMWDAVAQRGEVLISREAELQLETLRRKLRGIPGVFLDDRHCYSIRAFTYPDRASGNLSNILRSRRVSEVGDGAVAPLPGVLINQVMAELGLDRLSAHATSIDTTVTARQVNKGTGLLAIRDWVLGPQAETIAAGDQEPDLTMFAVASRSFAPANISCRNQARLLNCKIASQPYQRGLLEIAREIAKTYGEGQLAVPQPAQDLPPGEKLLVEALAAADQGAGGNLVRALASREALRIFTR